MTPNTQGSTRGARLVVLAVAAVAFLASAPGQSFLISVFVDDLLVGTGLSREAFSVLYAAGTIVSAVTMLVVGRSIDRVGLRTAWVVVSLGLAAACLLASWAAGVVTVFFAMAFLRTFGQGSFTLLGTLLVARSFPARRGPAMAVVTLGLTVASIALPPAVAALIVMTDWRLAYQVLALVLAVAVAPLALLVSPARPPAMEHHEGDDTQDDRGVAHRRLLGRDVALPTATAARLLVILAAPPLVGTALTFHAVSILAGQGLDYLAAGACLSVLGVASAVGTIAAGGLVDRWSSRASLLFVSVLTGAAPTLLLAHHPVAAYAAFAVLGLAMGSVGVVNGTIWARTYGVAGLGRLQGTAASSMITAAAVAPVVPAFASSGDADYAPAFVVLAALGLLAAALTRKVGAVTAGA